MNILIRCLVGIGGLMFCVLLAIIWGLVESRAKQYIHGQLIRLSIAVGVITSFTSVLISGQSNVIFCILNLGCWLLIGILGDLVACKRHERK